MTALGTPANEAISEREEAALPLLCIDDLAVSFAQGRRARAQAVDGVRLSLFGRQTLAVVGESGCGKSVTALSVLGLIPDPPGRIDRGEVQYRTSDRLGFGIIDLAHLDEPTLRQIRGSEIAMIFQEPMTSLNPVYTIGDQLTEAIRLHQEVGKREAREIAVRAMNDVGIPQPARRLRAYPHQFSGGMRQRAMIAMALACEPRVLLADEPTTALDVTIQLQILELLDVLKRERGLSVMLITHDLGVVSGHADAVCVMYAGRVVEYARTEALFADPMHPYTRGLLACVPRLRERRDRLTTVHEVVSDPGQFDRLGRDLRPWWAWHDPPAGVTPRRAGGGCALVELRPEHWVGVWRDSDEPDRFPVLPPRV